MNTTAYILLRLAAGISMLGHGLVRLPKLTAFSDGVVRDFEKSFLPAFLVKPYALALPFAELITGLLLVSGLFTRQAATSGGIVMLSLITGTCLIENWNALPSQLIHIAFFAILIQYTEANGLAVDKLRK